jgi:hypothetical protein
MTLTLSVVHIPGSTQTVLLIGMFLTPAMLLGGGSLRSGYPIAAQTHKA